jgi:myo-inositol-1(or 4)-monophosphatase
MLPDLKLLRVLVRDIAQAELSPRFADVQRHMKHDGSIVTEADLALQKRLQKELAQAWPEYGFLGEEMTAAEQEACLRAESAGFWCLDPLDGTSNFASGIPYFAVSLALIVGGQSVLGIVYDPVRDECFMAGRGLGAWLNGLSLGTRAPLNLPLARTIVAVDFKRLDAALSARLGAKPPFGSQRNFGSSALDWCWLADGRFHAYLHGGQKLWDYAAGHLILAEAGGQSVTIDGEEVFSPRLVSRSVVAARDFALFKEWRQWVGAATG